MKKALIEKAERDFNNKTRHFLQDAYDDIDGCDDLANDCAGEVADTLGKTEADKEELTDHLNNLWLEQTEEMRET